MLALFSKGRTSDVARAPVANRPVFSGLLRFYSETKKKQVAEKSAT